MSELADIFSGITAVEAERKRVRDERRQKNRADFPQVTAWVDQLREAFNLPETFSPVIWCEEGGRSVGKRPESKRAAA